MVLLDLAGRRDDVRVAHRVGHLLKADTASVQALRVDPDVVFAHSAAGHCDVCHAGQARQPRPQRVDCDVPQGRGVALLGRQAVTRDGEDGERQAVDVADRSRRRQAGRELRQPRLHELQREQHVRVPVEEEADVGAAPRRRGLDARNSGDPVHRLLDRARHRDEHLRRRHDPVVDDDDDAREVGLREDCGRKVESGVDPGRAEEQDEHDDRARLGGDEIREAHPGFADVLTSTLLPSGSA